MTAIRDHVVERFRHLYGRSPDLVVRAPGRVSLLGGHVDYNEGWVLPAAIDRAVWVAAGRGRDAEPVLRASSLELGDAAPVPLAPVPSPALPRPPWASPVPEGASRRAWIDYPTGVAWALSEAGHPVVALDAVVGSDLPHGAGLSSSAALEVAFLIAWRELGGFALDPLEAAQLGRRVENEYVGVQSGIMDQFASLAGRRNHAIVLDCRTLAWELLPLPEGVATLIADSGVRRRLIDGPLNDRRAECAEALRLLRERRPDLRALRDLDRATLDAADHLPDALRRRARHVVEECERVRRGAELLRQQRDAASFGALMRDSHASSRDLYQVCLPELNTLAEAAWAAPGCHGARLVGAGFGGCVVALVDAERAGEVTAEVERAFEARFARLPRIDRCAIADGAGVT